MNKLFVITVVTVDPYQIEVTASSDKQAIAMASDWHSYNDMTDIAWFKIERTTNYIQPKSALYGSEHLEF